MCVKVYILNEVGHFFLCFLLDAAFSTSFYNAQVKPSQLLTGLTLYPMYITIRWL